MSTDHTRPQLVSLSMPEVIDLGNGIAPATFAVTATGSAGIDRAVFWFDSPLGYAFSGATAAGSWPLMVVNGIWQDGQSSVTRHFAPDHSANAARTVSLSRVALEDINGNSTIYNAQTLAEMGLPTSFQITGGATDTTRPRLISISLPEVIDLDAGPASATFGLTAEDAAGIDRAVFHFDSPLGFAFSESATPGTQSLMVVNGIWQDGQSTVTRHFAAGHSANAPRTVSVDRVMLQDINGNQTVYLRQQLEEMGLRTDFQISGAAPDTTGPQLVGLSLPQIIDLGDGSAPATFTLSATDTAGIDRAVLWFDSPLGYGFSETATPNSLQMLVVNGIWENGQASLTRHFAAGHSANTPRTVSLDRIVLDDINGNSSVYHAPDLAEMGLPTSFKLWEGTPPTPELTYTTVRSADTLLLQIIDPSNARDGARLSGHITFDLDGASYVGTTAPGGGAVTHAEIEPSGSRFRLDLDATLAAFRPRGSHLLEITFDLEHSGLMRINSETLSINDRTADVEGIGRVRFSVFPPLVARDDTAEAIQDGPEISGNVLDNDTGEGLRVISAAGSVSGVGMPVSGDLGTLTLEEDGSFTYLTNLAAHLPAGVTAVDVFRYRVRDGGRQRENAELEITVTGVNDPASIDGDTAGLVTAGNPDRQMTAGQLTVIDPDQGEDRLQMPEAAALAGEFGTFTLNPETGAWDYTLGPQADALPHGSAAVTETLQVVSLDGTATETITITIEPPPLPEPDPRAQLSVAVLDRAGEPLDGTTVSFVADDDASYSGAPSPGGVLDFELAAGSAGWVQVTRAHTPQTDARPTAADALDVLRLAIGLPPSWGAARPLDFIAADINQDGQVTATDALEVLRAAIGLDTADGQRWIFLDPDADLTAISRSNSLVEPGLRVDPLPPGLTEVSLTGVLLGSVQDWA